MKAIIGAVVAGCVVFFVLTTYVFNPVMANDAPGAAMNPILALLVVSIVGALILAWIHGAVGSGVKAGAIIAISQIALVDIYYPMGGQRGWMTAVVSAVVLLVGWIIVGVVYDKLAGGAVAQA
jgi:hypothetical protein